jgi:hypothetical protein
MKMFRMFFAASVAGLLIAAPVRAAHAVDAHNHGATAKNAHSAKKIAVKKQAKSKHAGHMSMMQNCPMMQGAKGGKGNMQHSMLSGHRMSMSPRTQWHHNMMMWHHQMMHGQSPMHRGG